MSSLHRPLIGPRELDHAPTDLDGLIDRFFRAEMPEPWPVWKPPATLPVPMGGGLLRRRSLFRSRLALAASLLILLIGQVFVAGMFPSYSRFAAVSERGKTEATHRKVRIPKPASDFKKTEETHPASEKGMLISERR
jgi:hypothetical protein